jgi:hypothetical protein
MPFKKGVTPPGAKPFVKGQSGNPKGQPRKLVSRFVDLGYSKSEVNSTIAAMLAMTMDELKKVAESADSTILEKTIAFTLKKNLEKGSLYAVDLLLNRNHGKPQEMVEVNADIKKVIVVQYGNPENNNTIQSA